MCFCYNPRWQNPRGMIFYYNITTFHSGGFVEIQAKTTTAELIEKIAKDMRFAFKKIIT